MVWYQLPFLPKLNVWVCPLLCSSVLQNMLSATVQPILRSVSLNLTSRSVGRFAEAGFSTQHRLENMLVMVQECDAGEEYEMEECGRERGETYLRLRGWSPSSPLVKLLIHGFSFRFTAMAVPRPPAALHWLTSYLRTCRQASARLWPTGGRRYLPTVGETSREICPPPAL